MMRPFLATAALAIAAAATPAMADHHQGMDHSAHTSSQHMAMVLDDERRAGDRARDQYRNPAETLSFFRVEPGMTVVDYMPAGGWYTRVLVPYLGEDGRYIGLVPDPDAADSEGFENYFGSLPGRFEEARGEWNLSGAPVALYASQDLPEELEGSVDRVLIFREMHNLMRSGAAYTELRRIRQLLDDDGLVGVVQHRAGADAPADYVDGSKGYLRQADVVALMQAHGFELVGESEVNANPRDTADYPDGVWTLPPSLRGDDESKRAIGESDRMTLLFKKR